MENEGRGANSSAMFLMIAAPVGVTNSPSTPVEYTGTPDKISDVAGAGTGNTPCSHFTVPDPRCNGDEMILSGCS